jgi:hypothetical protein
MSSTPDWMRGERQDDDRPLRAGVPLAGVVVWTLGLVVVADVAMTVLHLLG